MTELGEARAFDLKRPCNDGNLLVFWAWVRGLVWADLRIRGGSCLGISIRFGRRRIG